MYFHKTFLIPEAFIIPVQFLLGQIYVFMLVMLVNNMFKTIPGILIGQVPERAPYDFNSVSAL